MSLLDVCAEFNSNFINNADMLEKHGVSISAAEEAIETKADASLMFEVQGVTEEMNLIKEHLKREEDQGINVSTSGVYVDRGSYVLISYGC